MPAPLRHRAKRHRVLIEVRKSLQTGYVAGKSKFPVAKGKRRKRFELSQNRVVTRHERKTIDPVRCGAARSRSGQNASRRKAADKLTPCYPRTLHLRSAE